MTTWTKLSERQPTEEDFKVGVVYGEYRHGAWQQSVIALGPPTAEWTHWQCASPPEQSRLRRWWLAGGSSFDELLYASYVSDDPIPVIEWPHKADPVPPQE